MILHAKAPHHGTVRKNKAFFDRKPQMETVFFAEKNRLSPVLTGAELFMPPIPPKNNFLGNKKAPAPQRNRDAFTVVPPWLRHCCRHSKPLTPIYAAVYSCSTAEPVSCKKPKRLLPFCAAEAFPPNCLSLKVRTKMYSFFSQPFAFFIMIRL